MKNLFILLALGAAPMLSADQYSQYSQWETAESSPNAYYQEEMQGDYYSQGSDQNYQSNYQYTSQPTQQYRNPNYIPQNQGYQADTGYRQQPQSQNYQHQAAQGSYQQSAADQALTSKIRDSLAGGWFTKAQHNVHFEVNNGEVTLGGTVNSQDEKNKIEEGIRKVEGVKNINSQITIGNENKRPSYTESQRPSQYTPSNK